MSRGAARDVRIEVAPGSIGVKFDPDYNGNAAVIKRFITLPSGQDSPLKRHVSPGWVLIEINDQSVNKTKHKDVLKLLQSTLNHRKTLIFRESSVHYAQHDAKGGAARKTDTVNLDIEVTQFRLNRDGSKQFGEYEVLCTLKKRNVSKNKLLQGGVWQRYSRFQSLHKSLTAQYGWQMKESKFPPKKTFGSLAPDFMEQRRRGLDLYMHFITQIRHVTEFNKEHLSSKDLKTFIDYEGGLKKLGVDLSDLNENIVECVREALTEHIGLAPSEFSLHHSCGVKMEEYKEANNIIDLFLNDIPYIFGTEKYNDDPRDLGNIRKLDDFYEKVEEMMTNMKRLIKKSN